MNDAASPKTEVPSALPNIVAAVQAFRESTSKTYPVRSLHASKIGHPCARFLVYRQTRWDLVPKADARLQGIFRRGRVIGEDVAIEVRDAMKAQGIPVVEQEGPIPSNPWDVGGKVDFGIMLPGPGPHDRPTFIPVEAKSMVPYEWEKIPLENAEAQAWFTGHRHAYMRCYPGQLLTYVHFRKAPFGILYVRNSQTFEDRQIVFEPNAEVMAEYLAKAAKVKSCVRAIADADDVVFHEANARAAAGDLTGPDRLAIEALDPMLPPRIPWHPDVCGKCDFAPWCIPDILNAPGILDRLDDDELNADCATYWECQDPRASYEGANERIGKHLKAVLAADPAGTVKTIVTKDFAIVARKSEKQIRKEIQPVATMNRPTP